MTWRTMNARRSKLISAAGGGPVGSGQCCPVIGKSRQNPAAKTRASGYHWRPGPRILRASPLHAAAVSNGEQDFLLVRGGAGSGGKS